MYTPLEQAEPGAASAAWMAQAVNGRMGVSKRMMIADVRPEVIAARKRLRDGVYTYIDLPFRYLLSVDHCRVACYPRDIEGGTYLRPSRAQWYCSTNVSRDYRTGAACRRTYVPVELVVYTLVECCPDHPARSRYETFSAKFAASIVFEYCERASRFM